MKIIYECEKLAILEDNERFIVHILDNYRMVKEVVANRGNLIPTLRKEFNTHDSKVKRGLFNRKKKDTFYNTNSLVDNIKRMLNICNFY